MSFNIFGPASKNSIRVGYISTDRGFVDNITVCEANDYAKLNPGTQFVFKTRKFIKYLNINEVNKLTPNDIISSEDSCDGIQLDADCGYPQAYFYGGGGVGVQGNPVFGEDGALLAVDLVHGGFGYQYPPLVEVKDNCGIGAGAVARAVLGEIVETVEYYDQEDDFEEYEICEPTDSGYGLRYGPDGKVLGDWDPTLYASITEDPIAREIKEYQDFLQKLQSPWWTTRKNNPLRVTSGNRTTRIKHDVIEPKPGGTWTDFLNKYAISPVPPSNAKGTDFGADLFTFEWEEEFPYDGEYVFRGSADGEIRDFYLDNIKIAKLNNFDNAPVVVKKTIKAGVHRIRLDLKNGQIKEKVVNQQKSQAKSQSSTQTEGTQTKVVFNTIDYINKGNRQLWRIDPKAGRDSDFINRYGVLPFDPNSTEAQTESFGGVHTIVWDNITFPIDGNYNIEVMVDDDVTLTFTGAEAETVITKRGYSSPEKSTGKSLETRAFKKGTYKLTAELNQLSGKPLGNGNPMALAVNVETSFTTNEVISPKSWNENPMGVALTIDAPNPPIPQEPIPTQKGRCPNNPIWSTRFPGANEKWWPVTFTGPPGFRWSKFMNRFAISPIPPLASVSSDGGGIIYRNSWNLDIPYDGFYGLKSTVDNAGKILIDDKVIVQADYIRGDGKKGISALKNENGVGTIYNFRVENPQTTKVFLTKGAHKISLEVENRKTEIYQKIEKKVFSTKDWIFPPKSKVVETIKTTDEYKSDEELYSPEYRDVDIVSTGSRYDRRPPAGYTILRTTHQGNMARGGSTGYIFRGPAAYYTRDNNVYWNYHPDAKPIPGLERVVGRVIERKKPLGTDPYIEGEYEQIDDETRITRGALVKDGIYGLKIWKKTESQTTSTVQTTKIDSSIVSQSPTAVGVVYEGPTPIANYKKDFISPVLQDINAVPNEEIQDKTWIFRWSNVDFPVAGQYTLTTEGDDLLIVRIDGVEVGKAKISEGRNQTKFNTTSGKKTVELELSNVRVPDTGFDKNPVIGFTEITVPVDVLTDKSKSWTENPVGISAILIPPPCPKVIRGKGVVTEVIVDDPGNGFPRPGTGGYPVALRLKSVVVEDPGINYNCAKDKIVIEPDFGCDLSYSCDTFGRITGVTVNGGCFGFTTYPEISIISDTGINASFRPQFEVIRDPIVEPQKLIQVTDLVGLKQTGYVEGRPYYGAVFYKNGIRYAGFYETAGDLVQVYDTLQDSIDARVTTQPSAIQRQGTDVSSNDPRLNIPGTPENLI